MNDILEHIAFGGGFILAIPILLLLYVLCKAITVGEWLLYSLKAQQ